jgi:hypothetical protein
MRLRNKKTGEIVDTLCRDDITKGLAFGVDHHDGNPTMVYYNSLAELNEEWEDVPEEPKGVWWLDNEGFVNHASSIDEDCFEKNKEIGNYFSTREEAEKAVEKLKAWKRLKDKGFRFKNWNTNMREIYFNVPDSFFPIENYTGHSITEETWNDLDLLFGGEDDKS